MEYVGRNCIINLEKIIHGNVLFFTQDPIFKIFSDIIKPQLKKVTVTFFTDITDNPKKEEIQFAQNSIKSSDFDFIIAFGGGSVIDFSKAYRFYEKKNIPLIAIPTTAGTGSQATQFAVVYENSVKTSLDDKSILPDIAIADSLFVENAPVYLKACSAIDAYCQAIESYWAVNSTKKSQQYALEAIKLCKENIKNAVLTTNPVSNEKMVQASHLAGKAINISRTTAAHALSYKITSVYGIPHGHAVALSMVDLFNANLRVDNSTCTDPRGVLFVKKQMETLLSIITENKISFENYWKNLMKDIHLEYDFELLKIKNLDEIFKSVNVQRLSNNPKNITSDMINFYKR